MKVRIRRAHQNIPLPAYATPESAAFDLSAAEDCLVSPGQILAVRTGLYVQCPPGYFLALFSRSSTPGKKGLDIPHGVGILDGDYAGPDDEVRIQVRNFTQAPVQIKSGDRIAQGIFLPVQQVEWVESESLRDSSRGGFGSTGH